MVLGHSLNAVLFLSLRKIISVYCSQEDYVLSLEIYLRKIWQIFEFEGILIIFLCLQMLYEILSKDLN